MEKYSIVAQVEHDGHARVHIVGGPDDGAAGKTGFLSPWCTTAYELTKWANSLIRDLEGIKQQAAYCFSEP